MPEADLLVHRRLSHGRAIRVLELLPSLIFRSRIHCRLKEFNLDDQKNGPQYEAISYVWGSQTGTFPINCDGKILLVTKNCVRAFYQLRRRRRSRVLWIDAVCIDQAKTSDAVDECAVQIQLMGEVYRSASEVIIWFGPAPAYSWIIVRFLEAHKRWRKDRPARFLHGRFSELGRFVSYWLMYAALVFIRILWRIVHLVTPSSHQRLDGEIWKLFRNPWFTRIWTLQEMIFSKQCIIRWGSESISWSTLHDSSFSFVNNNRHSGLRAVFPVTQSRNLLGFKESLQHIFEQGVMDSETISDPDWELGFLSTVVHHAATLPHDKVYGMYSFLRLLGLHLKEPNYHLPLNSLCEETTRSWLQAKRSLFIIILAVRPKTQNSTENLPSWVPDWTTSDPPPYLTKLDFNGFQSFVWNEKTRKYPRKLTFKASKGSRLDLHSSYQDGKLTLQGHDLGTISYARASRVVGDEDAHCQPPTRHWCSFLQAFQEWVIKVDAMDLYPTGETPFQAFISTSYWGEIQPVRYNFYEAFPHLYDLMLWPDCRVLDVEYIRSHFAIPVGPNINNLVALAKYSRLRLSNGRGDILLDSCVEYLTRHANYAFFILNSGYMGVAFHIIQEDDRIFLLKGLHIPVVLRPRGDEWLFVAPCYVHGVMDGEMWPKNEADLQDIVLV